MLDDKKQAELEQTIAGVKETIVPLIFSLYQGFKYEGFSEGQAFRLVLKYIEGMARGNIEGSNTG